MRRIPFQTVDVFTSVPFKGNPVAVVLDATALSTAQMQQIANWTNLSETTFVVPLSAEAEAAGADYHVRIFTPGAELPFAGHPTIGTAHALLEAGRIAATDGALVQQCVAGLVRLQVTHQDGLRVITFELPPATITPMGAAQIEELRAVLGHDIAFEQSPCVVDVGPRWVVAQLASADSVLACVPDLVRMEIQDRNARHTGVTIFGRQAPGHASAIEVRAFAPAHGMGEDPVCGSGNGAIAAYLRHSGQSAAFGPALLASQGAVVGRAGTIRLSISDDAILVGGHAVTCVEGSLLV